MSKELEVKMQDHWKTDGEITITKSANEPMVQTNNVTIHEAQELDSVSFMGVTAKTEHIGLGVIVIIVLFIAYKIIC